MPADFYKETPWAFGHTTTYFHKSQNHHKIVTKAPPYFLLVLFSLFATAYGVKYISQKNKSYTQTHWGMRLVHDDATSLTTR